MTFKDGCPLWYIDLLALNIQAGLKCLAKVDLYYTPSGLMYILVKAGGKVAKRCVDDEYLIDLIDPCSKRKAGIIAELAA